MRKLPSECESYVNPLILVVFHSDLELSAVCEKLEEKVNLSLYLQFSPWHIWSCFLLYVKSYKKRRISPHTCGCPCQDLKASFSCICEYWISRTCGFAISDLLLLPSSMWKATRRVNLSYVQFSMSDLKLLLCIWISCTCGFPFRICCFFRPVCEKMQEEWISHTYLWFFSFHIWSFFLYVNILYLRFCHFRSEAFFLYVKNCKSDIWYGTLQYVILYSIVLCLSFGARRREIRLFGFYTYHYWKLFSLIENFGFVRSC